MIIGAEARVGTLPFSLSPQLVAEQQTEHALSECLCRPSHGTNFDESPPGEWHLLRRQRGTPRGTPSLCTCSPHHALTSGSVRRFAHAFRTRGV
eukprot:COSAG06_NODE_4080_length_4593_cov_11.973971_5_plen_94_part_00